MQKYGQHFLVNKGIISKITQAVVDNAQGEIVEIGPGKGALTISLLENGINNFTAVEIDKEMSDYLKQNLPSYAQINIIEGNFLTVPASALPQGDKTFVSNLPYIDAADILLKVLDTEGFKAAVFMFQREQAQRLSAKEETKQYGPLSVIFQAFAQASSVCRVSPGSFNPPPKVDSEVLLITPKDGGLFKDAAHKNNFKVLVKAVFAYRRKTVLNALSETYRKHKDNIIPVLAKSGIKVSARAEELNYRKYADLAANLEGIIF